MPRRILSCEDEEIDGLLQRLENATDRHCRTLLWLLVHDSSEVREACNRIFDRPEEVGVDYFASEMHYNIIDGLATVTDVEEYIEDSKNAKLETQVKTLVELGIDLEVHHLRWPSSDLDILHGKIQSTLLEIMKEDVWCTNSIWSKMDRLVQDDVRYSLLGKKLEEDQKKQEQAGIRDNQCRWDHTGGGRM